MTFISYAQNHEDVLLNRLFPPGHKGFYIDLGANHPIKHNVTKHFYDAGWNGINVEPSTPLFRLLSELRTRDVNLHAGVSNQAATLTFFRVEDKGFPDGLSHFDPDVAAHQRSLGLTVREESIPVMTLREICERHVTRPIDFLKIDVEGFERKVIEGADFKTFRPRCVVIEDGDWNGTRARFDWQPLFEAQRFQLAAHDGLNCYYVDVADLEAMEKLRYPVNSFDDFIPYRYASLIEAQEMIQDLGPTGAKKVRALARWLRSHPLLFRTAKKLMRVRSDLD